MTEKLDPELAAHRVVEAAIRNERALTETIEALKKAQTDFRVATNSIPRLVDSRINAILNTVVNDAATRISQKFTDAEMKAAALSHHYDRLLKDNVWTILGYLLFSGAVLAISIVVAGYIIKTWLP